MSKEIQINISTGQMAEKNILENIFEDFEDEKATKAEFNERFKELQITTTASIIEYLDHLNLDYYVMLPPSSIEGEYDLVVSDCELE